MAKYIDPRATKEMTKTPNKLNEMMDETIDFNEQFTPIQTEPPKHLDRVAKKYYRIFVAEIEKLGTGNILDEAHLENLCETLSDIRHYRDELKMYEKEHKSRFIQGPHNIKEHPAVKAIDTATKNSIRLMNELNLSATTRHMLQKKTKDEGFGEL